MSTYKYMLYGDYIVINGTNDYASWSNPENNKALRLYYTYKPAVLANDTDTPEKGISDMYHTALVDYALFKITGNPAYYQMYTMAVKDARANKTSGPKTIKQTFF